MSDIDGGDVEYSDAQQNEEARNMPPIVVDAGALDLLPRHVPSQVVLTPHANELSRLLTRIDEPVNAAEIEQRPCISHDVRHVSPGPQCCSRVR